MTPLAQYLKDERVTQETFARRIGRTQSIVSKLASGTITPTLETALAIETATGGAVPPSAWAPEQRGAA